MVMSILAIIPARSGSKGIHDKNIADLGGHPLLAHAILEARSIPQIDKLIVSTDSSEYAAIARNYGAETPFLRPKNLSADSSPGIATVHHALSFMTEFQTVILLQPTSPFRKASHIIEAISKFQNSSSSSLVSICRVSKHPNWMFKINQQDHLKKYDNQALFASRQELGELYVPNGAIYMAHTHWVNNVESFFGDCTLGFLMDNLSSFVY